MIKKLNWQRNDLDKDQFAAVVLSRSNKDFNELRLGKELHNIAKCIRINMVYKGELCGRGPPPPPPTVTMRNTVDLIMYLYGMTIM